MKHLADRARTGWFVVAVLACGCSTSTRPTKSDVAADAKAPSDAVVRADQPSPPDTAADLAPEATTAADVADVGSDGPAPADAPRDSSAEANTDVATDAATDAAAERGPDSRPPADAAAEARDNGGPDMLPAPADALALGPVTLVADTVLSSNATAIKSYDTNVNIASYRHHGIVYHEGYQYVSWYNGNTRNAIVGRRSLDAATLHAGPWSWAYVDFVLDASGDSHNVMSMGVSSDGRLHVAIGQHGAQLYSIRSVTGALAAVTWDNTAFGGTGTSASGAAKPATGLPGYSGPTGDATYPYFVTAPDGTFQLAYRTGGSGDGEMRLAEYSTSSGNWSVVGPFTSASGSYTQNGKTSTSRNAYPHGLDYDGAGRLHMTFTFREDLDVTWFADCADTISNHDTLYVYSDDHGRTWKNNAGTTVADTKAGTTAGIGSSGLVVDPLPIGRDMMNQETQVTDHRNLIHAIISYVPDRLQTTCANDRTHAQPHHLWRDPDGKWSKSELKLGSKDIDQGYDRAKVFVDASDNLYVLLPDLRLLGATAASGWSDWQLLWDGRSRGNYGEAIIDYDLTRVTNAVSILYMKDTSSATAELHVLELKLGS